MNHPERKIPVHQPLYDVGNRSNIIFVTVCTKSRKKILDNPEVHHHLIDIWNNSTQWLVGRYVILPNHIHLFCSPAKYEAENARNWITYWKRLTSINWPIDSQKPIWQPEA